MGVAKTKTKAQFSLIANWICESLGTFQLHAGGICIEQPQAFWAIFCSKPMPSGSMDL
jgi:hypothetical protein